LTDVFCAKSVLVCNVLMMRKICLLLITVQLVDIKKDFVAKCVIGMVLFMLATPFNIFSANPNKPVRPARRADKPVVEKSVSTLPDSIPLSAPVSTPAAVVEDAFTLEGDTIMLAPMDTIPIVDSPEMKLFSDSTLVDGPRENYGKVFTPNPTRAVWLSALFPGLGQIYNRRYWKLPLVIGGFMGLGYGASWNNMMLRDYTRAYTDIMDNDPSTNSYMDFFPPNTDESTLNKSWLERTLKSRKDYYRRNRDLCVISMIGVYLLAMVDAYVDASLSNFDISPDLSMQVAPVMMQDVGSPFPVLGVQMAVNF